MENLPPVPKIGERKREPKDPKEPRERRPLTGIARLAKCWFIVSLIAAMAVISFVLTLIVSSVWEGDPYWAVWDIILAFIQFAGLPLTITILNMTIASLVWVYFKDYHQSGNE